MKDIIGKAICDYFNGDCPENISTETSISDEDVLPVAYLFRKYKKMPFLEQLALDKCHGKVLDVGCGAGSHSLYLQNKRKLDVTAIDISPGAIKTCEKRGLKRVFTQNVFNLENASFDTILMLMNGTGLFGTYKTVPEKLRHLTSLLNSGGQILIDSSDIIFMFDTDDDGGKWVPTNNDYYGELEYILKYKGETETTTWLYLDFNTLKHLCEQVGLCCELIAEGDHYDYLAKITLSLSV